jgi:hypothetical protein
MSKILLLDAGRNNGRVSPDRPRSSRAPNTRSGTGHLARIPWPHPESLWTGKDTYLVTGTSDKETTIDARRIGRTEMG